MTKSLITLSSAYLDIKKFDKVSGNLSLLFVTVNNEMYLILSILYNENVIYIRYNKTLDHFHLGPLNQASILTRILLN